jgi:hypothetical protein
LVIAHKSKESLDLRGFHTVSASIYHRAAILPSQPRPSAPESGPGKTRQVCPTNVAKGDNAAWFDICTELRYNAKLLGGCPMAAAGTAMSSWSDEEQE